MSASMGTLTTHSLPASASMRRGDETRKRFSARCESAWGREKAPSSGGRGLRVHHAFSTFLLSKTIRGARIGSRKKGPPKPGGQGGADCWFDARMANSSRRKPFLGGRAHRCHNEIAILRTKLSGKCGVGQLVVTRPTALCVMARPDPSRGGPNGGSGSYAGPFRPEGQMSR